MSEYTPDRWIPVRITKGSKSIVKILSGWSGGYLYGDSWRLSSGVTEVEDKDSHFMIRNESGSVYTCYKSAYGVNGISGSILHSWQEQAKLQDDIQIEVLTDEEVDTWTERG